MNPEEIVLVVLPELKITQTLISPILINLKGKRDILGPQLQKSQANMIYIGRQMYMGGWKLPKSKWFNPYSVKKYGRTDAVKLYQEHIINHRELFNSLTELNGKQLACWCHPNSCHGDVLIKLFNQFVNSN